MTKKLSVAQGEWLFSQWTHWSGIDLIYRVQSISCEDPISDEISDGICFGLPFDLIGLGESRIIE